MKKANSNSNGLWTALAIVLIILLIRFSCTGRLCGDGGSGESISIESCLGYNAPRGFGGGSSRGAGAGGRG